MSEAAPTQPGLIELRDRLRGLEGLADWPALERWSRLLDLAAARRSLPADAPLLTVLVGPTGVGKSTLFNQIVGRAVSTTGAVRPCTYHPVGVAHSEVVEFFRQDPALKRFLPDLQWNVQPIESNSLGHQALVDTPDFDSVAEENRRAADRLLHRADRVIVVLGPEKYGDAIVWDTLERLRPLGNVIGCVFNKARDGAALEDFTRLLGDVGLPPPVVVPRLPHPDDPQAWEPALRRDLLRLVELPESPQAVLSERRAALERWEAELRRENLEPWVESLHDALTQAEAQLKELAAETPRRVREKLQLALDEAITRELQERFLESIQKYDILREPRRWLSAPIRWLGEVLPFGSGSSPAAEAEGAPTSEWLIRGYRDRYQEFVIELADKLRSVAATASRSTTPPVPWPGVPEPDRESATQSLRRVFADLQEELERETLRIAKGISGAGKVRFYGSQALFQLLMLSIFVNTGGGLTLGELAAQGLISPYGAKLFARMVSTGEASAVQSRLEAFLADRIAREVLPLLEPLERHVQAVRRSAGTPSEWREAARRWEARETHAAQP